ncbi:hypothetical protein GA0061098_1019123 [Bradyrhizobium shewense]|uniref:Uncharacterized protein n=1 Tax=Bradyrhizobium shewense TaxID=1761772 RepID=A0A1C3XMI5_9BRAD|nr:hypothetical protein GA0061098_1019123 [Bradyrhizobium shewense]
METLARVIPGRLAEPNPESRDSPVRSCAPEVWSFGPSRNDEATYRASGLEFDGSGGGGRRGGGGMRQAPALRPAISQ